MKIRELVIYSAVTLLYFISCTKEKEMKPDPDPGSVNGSVSGVVTDLNNSPLSNATVSGGTDTTSTDATGKFNLTKVKFTSDSVVVTVTNSGFFQGSKSFGASNNSVSNAVIQLIPKPAATTITSSSGGNVSVSGGGAIDFTGGFINASTGSAHTGNVSVSTVYLNPTDQNFSASVPGDLIGVNAANQPGILQSFGAVAVELNDESGIKVQLAQGNTATITLPIPASLQGSAPAAIPLWYFDDTKGWWKEEGMATRQGNDYVGVVNHFSFWNVGDISGAINIQVIVTMDTGLAYRNKLVTITRPDSTSTEGYTDNAGIVTGSVPVNEQLLVQVFNDCGKNVFAKNIGPFSSDATVNVHVASDDCLSADTTQFLRLTINGNRNYSWPSAHIRQSFEAGSNTFIMGGQLLNSDTTIEGIIFGGIASPGSYPMGLLIVEKGSYNYQAGGQAYDPSYPYPTTTITKYDDVGGYIEGTISGMIKTFPSTATADSFPVTGSYRVKRIQ
jgi:hypothetical protein